MSTVAPFMEYKKGISTCGSKQNHIAMFTTGKTEHIYICYGWWMKINAAINWIKLGLGNIIKHI